jgi:hypothetical protein
MASNVRNVREGFLIFRRGCVRFVRGAWGLMWQRGIVKLLLTLIIIKLIMLIKLIMVIGLIMAI